MRSRAYLVLCCILSASLTLAGGIAASAETVRHRNQAADRKAKHHRKGHHAAVISVLPAMGALPSPSIFGVNTLGYDSSQANFERDAPTARSMGARWVHFTGDSVHFYGDGRPDWKTLDSEVTQARKLGLGVLISLGGNPAACSVSSARSSPQNCPPTTSRDLVAYVSFLRTELWRYHNDVQYWESWLEPNNGPWWHGQADPRQYANLLRAQYGVFQSFNRTHGTDLKLLFAGPISFSTAPGSQGAIAVLPFVRRVLNDLHGARVFDAVGLHAYRFPSNDNGPADLDWGPSAMEWDYVNGLTFSPTGCNGGARWCQMNWPEELQAYEREFANHGYGETPLWLTEFGWPGNASPSTALYPSYGAQANNLSRAYSDILNLPFVQAAFWFNLRDYQPGFSSPDPAFFYHYGLLDYEFNQKPAASEFEQLAAANPGR